MKIDDCILYNFETVDRNQLKNAVNENDYGILICTIRTSTQTAFHSLCASR